MWKSATHQYLLNGFDLDFFLFSLQGLNTESGYGAPEAAISGKCSTKSDVYSFGVVMLELFSGRKPFDW